MTTPHAAPPDDGHHGSDTRPDETLAYDDGRAFRAPELHRDASHGGDGVAGSLVALGIAVVVVAWLLLQYAPVPP